MLVTTSGNEMLILMNTMVIGIAGGTGSGKTTLTQKIVESFSENISVIYHDNYYKAHDELPYEERAKLNYDHPDAFDTALMIKHIKTLKEGNSVKCPTYDYTVHNRSELTVEINPAKVLIVEGIMIFQNQVLRELMDIKIFVDTDADVRIIRRILRDVQERKRSLESVVNQYLGTVKPMHEQFVEPSKRCADIVVLDGGHNLVALDMIMQRIRGHVNG
jgi:uridine kinase